MTDSIPQTSASDRYDVAREVLAAYDDPEAEWQPTEVDLAETLRALITPPGVGESEEEIAERIADDILLDTEFYADKALHPALVAAVRAGIQSAHETWEPADIPSQEQMLRWLGVKFEQRDEYDFFIPKQYIEREEI